MGRERVDPVAISTPAIALTTASLGRFVAQGMIAVLGLMTGAALARRLGPVGKGTVSMLGYLVALHVPAVSLGVGEAGIARIARGKSRLQEAVSASLGLLLCTGAVGVVLLVGTAFAIYARRWDEVAAPALLAALCVPVGAVATVLGLLVEGQGRIGFASRVRVAVAGVTAVATLCLVIALSWGIAGALLALFLGWGVGAVLLVADLLRRHHSLRPALPSAYLSQAVRFGLPIQVSQLIIVLSARIDLIPLQAISGDRAAGIYSVALTFGQLPAYAGAAIAASAFPRLASMRADHALVLTARLARLSMTASLLLACVLGVAAPLLIPAGFGPGFRPSIAPTLILLLGAVAYSGQLLLCRASAAMERPGILWRSFGLSLGVMLALDLALIPRLDVHGASLASAVSALAGLTFAGASYLRMHRGRLRLTDLIPGVKELAELVSVPGRLVATVRS